MAEGDDRNSGTPESSRLRADVIDVLRTIHDPEIPVNIYDLGLIYGLDVDREGNVAVRMTLTAPACPVAGTFPDVVASNLLQLAGVRSVNVDLVWDPPWRPDSLPEDVKLQLGLL
jgi:FeS assembly SUF system protein